jgi:UDP-glucose 4-epimerase
MNILITGGNGFLGTHLTQFLNNQGHNITIFDNFSNSKLSESKNKIKIIEGDILDYSKLSKSMKDMDFIIHLAAQINVEDSINNPEHTMSINVQGTKNVLQSCVDNKISKFIAASSAAVFGNNLHMPLTEESSKNPISPYGQSKLFMEEIILKYSKQYNLNSIILRFFNLYGVGQSKQYAGVISKFIDKIKKNKNLEIYGAGEQSRDFIHIDDAINSINLAVKNINGKIGKIYNVGNGTSTTILELAQLLLKISKKHLQIIHKSQLDGDIIHSQTSIKEITNDLGFRPQISLEKGLKQLFH